MSEQTIKIPILVRDHHIGEKVFFALRPIFVPSMIVIEARFEQAVERLKKNYHQMMIADVRDKKYLNKILLSLYYPSFKYKQVAVEFKLEHIQVKGKFSAIVFDEAGYSFVQLPFINNFLYISKYPLNQKAKFVAEFSQVVHTLLSELKQGEEDFQIKNYYSTNKEYVHYIEIPNLFQPGSFPDKNETQFSFFGAEQEDDFHGLTELYKVGFSYTEQYPELLDRAFFQDKVIERLTELVFNPNQSSIVLVGELGIGKHTLISEMVYRYIYRSHSEDSQSRLRNVWKIDPIRLIAGMAYVGSWQRRLNAIISYLKSPQQEAEQTDILLVDNPVALLNIGKSAKNDMAIKDVLKPILEKKLLPVVLLATPEEWEIVQEKDRGFSTLFQVIRLEEPDEKLAIKILLKKRTFLENYHSMRFTIQAIGQLIDLYRSYRKQEVLPGSLINHLAQIAAKKPGQVVDVPDIVHEFSATSGVSDSIVGWEDDFSNKKLHHFFAQRVIGQEEVVDALVNVSNLIKAKLTVANKPYSSFLFVGPTGVGKTQAAKALSEYIMGSEKALIRFDMNEFIDYFAVERLIGSAYTPEGVLTERLRHHPYGVVLFDEIEKAHPAVLDLMLQILDEGQLTDGAGRKVDFSKTIIMMTSNVGANAINAHVGFGNNQVDEKAIYLKEIGKTFRPEWVNRIDEIIVFNSLEKKHLIQIAQLQIKELFHREGFTRRMTILNISQEVLKWVADRGHDPKMGGRALKRQIENDLTKLTAEYLVNVTHNAPIIFTILLENNALVPAVTQLNFPSNKGIDFFPAIPVFEKGGMAYGGLLRRVSTLERLISKNAPITGETIDTNQARRNWEYYDFQTKVTDLKTELMAMKNGFNDNNYLQNNDRPIRSRFVDWKGDSSQQIIDVLFEKLSHAFFKTKPLFDEFATEYLQYLIQVHLYERQAVSFARDDWQVVNLKFSSLIQGRGEAYCAFLFDKYRQLFSQQKLLKTANENDLVLTIEGYGVFDMVRNEHAVHLFLSRQASSVPIQVEVIDTSVPYVKKNEMNVSKVYQEGQTMLDLKLGLLNLFDFNTKELLLMFYMGMN